MQTKILCNSICEMECTQNTSVVSEQYQDNYKLKERIKSSDNHKYTNTL